MAVLIKFLFSPVGKWAMIGLALVAWTVYQREQAADKARESCQAEQLLKTVNEITRQRDAAQAALDTARTQEGKTAEEISKLESDLAQIKKLQDGGSCSIPLSTLERLRDIR